MIRPSLAVAAVLLLSACPRADPSPSTTTSTPSGSATVSNPPLAAPVSPTPTTPAGERGDDGHTGHQEGMPSGMEMNGHGGGHPGPMGKHPGHP